MALTQTDLDTLDADASLISSFPVDQGKELSAIYKQRRAELN